MVWAKVVLKHCDAVLAKVKDSISFESFMDLSNDKLSGSTELFLGDILEKAVEKSSWVLHDEDIPKAVSADKPPRTSVKKLHFSQSSRQQQHQPKCPSVPLSCKSSFPSSASAFSSGSKTSSSSARRGKGKKF